MFTRKTFSILLSLAVYFVASSVSVHAISMNMIQEDAGMTEVQMSDCGMQIKSVTDDVTKNTCLQQCVGDYDNISYVALTLTPTPTCITKTTDFFSCATDYLERNDATLAHAPPDRGVIYSKQTPYFSHSNTTQIL